jgi:putative effector of murein hydrolase
MIRKYFLFDLKQEKTSLVTLDGIVLSFITIFLLLLKKSLKYRDYENKRQNKKKIMNLVSHICNRREELFQVDGLLPQFGLSW